VTADPILQSEKDLDGYFLRGCKPPADWGVGIEYERAGVLTGTGRAAPYSGTRSISALLARLTASHGWRPLHHGSHVIALEKDRIRITMEPGGQVELSGAIHRELDAVREEVEGWAAQLALVAEPLGISWPGVGLQPFSPLSEIEWTPKPRYTVMSAHLARTGTMGHVMMKQTAGVQVNLDYSDESDALEKFRVAMGITSLVTALFANSPLVEGRDSGFASYRSWAWQHTDPARCGLLPFVLREDAGFSDYLEYALSVPTMFILRRGAFVDLRGIPFREFLARGCDGHRATLSDFQLHLTTLFPEVRLKHHLEVRGGDSGDPEHALAQVALWKGILYDPGARREAWKLVSDLSFEERTAFHRDAARRGSGAILRRRSALELGAELHRIAADGLRRQGEPDRYLAPLARILFEWRASPSRRLLERWNGEWQRDPRRLVTETSRLPALRVASGGDKRAHDP
jgi:glutamate--cysteine ligase